VLFIRVVYRVKKSLVVLLLTLLLPIQSKEVEVATPRAPRSPIVVVAAPRIVKALDDYRSTLVSHGESLDDQGILIETVEGGSILAQHNADTTFNPASVMKLATTSAAIAKFGPDHRYRTNFFADGEVDRGARRLSGDLVVEGGCNPMFSQADAQQIAQDLSGAGITRVTGRLRIAGPFYYFATGYHCNLSRETSALKLKDALRRSGCRIDGPTCFGEKSGTLLVSHYSDQLERILLFQNAHSSNAVAEVVGESVGGPSAIQAYLTTELDLAETDLYVGRACGLGFNRITPRASLKMLRRLVAMLGKYSLKPEDVMPVAGVDSGTLRTRLTGDQVRGAIVAKTGTLNSVDRGVSTLVGIAHTRTGGLLLFAIFDSGGPVHAYRRLQDKFVEEFIAEEGGGSPIGRLADAVADYTGKCIVQIFNPLAAQAADLLPGSLQR
jgi:D-alanyl-D-alanine carboxypeptidase/D-alanyl-D-alanine-endopeptidase (penicillin-binding protein 4)